MKLTGEQLVALLNGLPAVLAAIAALIAAVRARQDAREAKTVANTAHEKANEAHREQINFALRREAERAAQAAQVQKGKTHGG